MLSKLHKGIRFISSSTPKTITLLIITFFMGASFLGFLQLSNQTPQSVQRIADDSTPSVDSVEQELFVLINEFRDQNNATQVKMSTTLTKASQWMADDLASHNRLSHTDSQGRNINKRLPAFGYPSPPNIISENAGFSGASTAQAIFDGFYNECDPNSSGTCTYAHRENMRDPAWRAIGIGRAQGTNGWYWVTDFGSRLDQELTLSSPDPSISPEPSVSPIITFPPSTGDPSPTVTTQPSPTTQAPSAGGNISIELRIKLPGIGTNTNLGENNNPRKKTRDFTVQLLNEDGSIHTESVVSLPYTNGLYKGSANFSNIGVGAYELRVATSNSLFRAIPGVINITPNSSNFSPSQVTLVSGNINQTGGSKDFIDIFDYNTLLSCYDGASCTNSGAADLNDDGKVDSLDLNILLRSFSIQRE